MDLGLNIKFNPAYSLRLDEKRVLIVNVDNDNVFPQVTHPMFAALFSFFRGDKSIQRLLPDICDFFHISEEKAMELVEIFFEKDKEIALKYDETVFAFPENILVTNYEKTVRTDLDVKQVLIAPPYDFENQRLYIPQDILFVINTKCVTDCVYCYADKQHKYEPLPTNRILEIIQDAYNLGVKTFELSGGEVLMNKDWKIILKKLVDCGYSEFISTKIPMTKEQIDDLVETGQKCVQISLDSLNPKLLASNLNVKELYCEQMKECLKYLDTKDIEIIIKGTHTKHTFTIDNIKEIMSFIGTLNHLKKYTVSVIGASHYKSLKSFHELKPSMEQVDSVYGYLETCDTPYYIQLDNQATLRKELCNYGEFKKRSLCTGNVSGFVILPDGKVTICEELYWNKNFIIGDLSESSIMEVWGSPKAMSLWNLQQDKIPQTSACHSCQDFLNCRKQKGVCWKEAIFVYGEDNYLNPDPRCPKAPEPINDIFYD